MSGDHWVVAYEVPTSRVAIPVPVGMRIEMDRPLVVGREGELPLGVDIPDSGVSREALVVAATRDGWRVEIANRNGAVLHPWGQPATVAQPRTLISWPLVALRVRGSVKDAQHWLLLESTLYQGAAGEENTRMRSATRTMSGAAVSEGRLAKRPASSSGTPASTSLPLRAARALKLSSDSAPSSAASTAAMPSR